MNGVSVDQAQTAEMSAESAAAEERLLREKQRCENQRAIQVLQALRAEEAQLSLEEEALLTAEWEQLERLVTAERV